MYRLIAFGPTSLEYRNQVDDIGTGSTPTSYQQLPNGGAIDGFGSEIKQPGVVDRKKTLRITSSSQTEIEQIFFSLLALRGKKDKLYRRTTTGDIQWMYARCVDVTVTRSYDQAKFKYIQDIDLLFSCQEAAWRGNDHAILNFDSGLFFDAGLNFDSSLVFGLSSSPTNFPISIDVIGHSPSKNIKVTVQAGTIAMSAVTISRSGGESLTYSGTIPSGGSLVIDTGTMQVTCTGVSNAYDNLVFSPTADMASWLTLLPGTNNLSVSYTGGGTGASIGFEFFEAWY